MELFSALSNAWHSLTGSTDIGTVVHAINIDGTPMAGNNVDIYGNPFGVTQTHLDSHGVDAGPMDNGSAWSGSMDSSH